MLQNKKQSMVYIIEVLKKYSDANNSLSISKIQEILKKDYDFDLERKAVIRNIDTISELGYDIVETKKRHFYLGERVFDINEIRFLVDAIFSSKVVSDVQAKELSNKLLSFLSVNQRKSYDYLYKSTQINRTSSSELFLNIELINEAILKNKQIKFQYQYYDENKNLYIANPNKYYRASAYYLINNFGKYYVITNYDRYEDVTIYRVEMMTNVSIIDKDRNEVANIPMLGNNFNIAEYINNHIYLFGGEVINCVVELTDNKAISYVVDWFSDNATIYKKDDKTYANITCDEKALFYWLLQYTQYIKIKEPISLKNKLVNTLKDQLEKYSD